MASSSSHGYSLSGFTQLWYDEVNFFPASTVGAFDGNAGIGGEVIGHYTAVVWADTEYVGCGVINYTTDNQYQIGSQRVIRNFTFEII